MNSKKHKQSNSQERRIIYKTYMYFVNEAYAFKNSEDRYFRKIIERTANATGFSKKLVSSVLNERDQTDNVSSNEDKGTKNKIFDGGIDKYIWDKISNIIYDIYLKTGEAFSLSILHQSLIETIDFDDSIDTLKKIVKKMGFVFMKIENNKRVIIEKPSVRLKRLQYIHEIQKLRNDGRSIFYVGETLVDSVASKKKKITKRAMSQQELIIVLHAGNENGFLANALHMSKCYKTNDDYEKQFSAIFHEWTRDRLIPSLPPNSVIVIENIPQYNEFYKKPPHAYSPKDELVAWLSENGIAFDPNSTKPELHNLIKTHKDSVSPYILDRILLDYGHTVLRFPKYHTDFNPVEKIWADLKGYIEENKRGLNINKIKMLISEKIEEMGKEEWNKACQDVIDLENEYLTFENDFIKHIDNLILTEVDDYDSELDVSEASASESTDSD